MENFHIFLLIVSSLTYIHAQKFEKESPYMLVRLMDAKIHQWKPGMLDEMEQVLDAELKYTDERKGIACQKIDFEQEVGYPKQDSRFIDLSIRGLCTDVDGKVHNIDKELIIVAIERHIAEVSAVTGAVVYRVGNVQLFKHNKNLLNLIIIPISVGLVVLLIVVTFVLRHIRYKQKRRHIEEELQKKKDANAKKATTIPNVDPHATEKQRLLQLDPTVVGNASDTLGSPKEFTNDQFSNISRQNPTTTNNNNRQYQSGPPPPIPTKDNRPPYYNQQDETSYQNQRSNKSSSRERVPYENQPRFSPNQYDQQYPDMIPMQEQQPRVTVKTIRGDDGNQQRDDSSRTFVPIPVQIERSANNQRHVPPPYHSDPYYRHTNA